MVILGAWRPFRVVAGALLYGAMISLGMTVQARNWNLPFLAPRDLSFFLSLLPYLVTIVAILIPAGAGKFGHRIRSISAPGGLAVPYPREER